MSPADHRNTIRFDEILTILLGRKRQIATTFLATFGVICLITLLIPKKYESRLKLLVRNDRSEMIVSGDTSTPSGYNATVGEEQINSEIELLSSRGLLRQVVIDCGLFERQGGPPLSGERREVAIERAVARLQQKLTVSSARLANIIDVTYVSPSPRMAMQVLQQLAASYLELHLKVHGSPGTYEFFAQQRDRYEKDLRAVGTKLENFNQRQNISVLSQQKEILLQREAEAEYELMQADALIHQSTEEIANAHIQLTRTAPRITTMSRTIPNGESVERLNTMLVQLQNRRTELAAKFLPGDRTIKEVDQEINDTKAALDRATKLNGVEGATDVNPISQSLDLDLAKDQLQLAGTEGRRRVLARQTETYRERLRDLNTITDAEDSLLRKQKEAEDNYQLYAKKAEEARIGELLDRQKIANVVIAEAPTEPHLPSAPNVPLNLALGLVFAGVFSIGGAFVAEYFAGPVEGSLELEQLTGLPVLAAVYLP